MTKKRSIEYRSRHAIKQAFISLLQEKSYSSITIQDILDKSGYSRGTFYTHFQHKDDLAYKLIDDEVSIYMDCTTQYLSDIRKARPVEEMREEILDGVNRYFTYVYDNQTFYKLIAEHRIPGINMNTLATLHYERTKETFHITSESAINLDLNIFLVTSAHIQSIRYWLSHDFAQSPKYMAEQVTQIMRQDVPITMKASDHQRLQNQER